MIPLRLYSNFRSQAAIVEWVNDTMGAIMPLEDDVNSGAVRYVRSEPTIPAGEEAVILRPVFSGGGEEEAETIAGLVRDALSGSLCGPVTSVGVLVRGRSHLHHIVPRLRRENIPFQAVEIEQLGRHPAVRDAMALTRTLTDEGDRIAWLAVLRAPWCGATLEDIHRLCADAPQASIADCLTDGDRIERCSGDAQRRFVRLRSIMQDVRAQRGRKTLRRLVEGCWIALGGPATVDSQGFSAVMAYLDMLEECDTGGDLTEAHVLADRVTALFAPVEKSGGSVQLMTVHKAKGLQFDVVIVPRMDGVPRSDQERLLLWMERPSPAGVDFIIAPIRERGTEQNATYRYVRSIQSEKDRNEAFRLLYVAATRARCRLVLTAVLRTAEKDDAPELRPPSKNSFLGYLWPVVEDVIRTEWEALHSGGQGRMDEERSPAQGIPLRRLPRDWQPPRPESPPVIMSSQPVSRAAWRGQDMFWTAGEDARVTGIVVHRLLARIGTAGAMWWTERDAGAKHEIVRTLFTHEGRQDISVERLNQAVAAIDRMLADRRGAWILAQHPDARCEEKLIGMTESGSEAAVLDRTFVDEEGTRWIIDYKSAEHEGGSREEFLEIQVRRYSEQLHRYARIMRALDARPLRMALYFPLLQEFREVPVPASPPDTDSSP